MSEEQLQHKGFEYESADDSCAVAGLRILVSEDLLVDKPLYATLLNQKYHIHCHDAPLAPPIAFVVDELTGVSILPEEVLVDRENLKIFLRQLTRNAYRYDTLWLVISHNNSSISSGTNSGTIHLHGDMAALGQCLSQFPCTVAVRQVEELAVADCLRAICVQAAAPHRRGNMIASWYKDRPALLRLSNPVFAAHCEFLQLFPSINFFLAIKILSRWRLSELPHIDERSLNDAFPVRCSGSLQRFVRVMHLAFHDRQSARGDQFA
ncbi:unnamed protein product [Symbiodinium microadriaticum]|nr:unnamed protein product [Symbiodinium microadriaticum]